MVVVLHPWQNESVDVPHASDDAVARETSQQLSFSLLEEQLPGIETFVAHNIH